MKNWLVNYFTRKDTRWGFWKEDMKVYLIYTGVMLGVYYGYQKYLDWKDRERTETRIKEAVENNYDLNEYMKEED